jgi:ribosomal protein L37AE/L43A
MSKEDWYRAAAELAARRHGVNVAVTEPCQPGECRWHIRHKSIDGDIWRCAVCGAEKLT